MGMKNLFSAMRPHQWTKGIFIFLPIVFGQLLFDLHVLLRTFFMFILFSLAASAMYLINDIIDLEEDSRHPEKRKRALASGKITVLQSVITVSVILSVTIPLSFILDVRAGLLILGYLSSNYLYMRWLKRAVIIDVFCIGLFFYLRVLAGSIASDIVLSNWIVICTVLLALFLGFNKRRYDLEFSKKDRPVFEKYSIYFVDRMISVIASSLIVAYTIYVMDDTTVARFQTDNLIYSVPFVYYGIFRYLYLIGTKWFGGDPARIMLGDYKIQITMALWLMVCVAVIYF
jgi:4-hydroxybenzoate polyprenyltransferase